MTPTIALCIMVKNEEKTLPRLLASVQGFVDRVVVLDTGSTDQTRELLRDYDGNFDGGIDIIELPFHNFGRSRTQLMQFAKGKADWLLLMDADQTLRVPQANQIRERALVYALTDGATAFSIQHAGTHPYWVPRLVRGDRDWKFVGATHEYLEQSERALKLHGLEIVHHADGGARADKFTRDYELLSQEIKDDPTNSRAVFYLANTCRDLGRLNEARELYYRRAAMGGWDEEVFMARLGAAQISLDPLELWETWASRPTRAEPLFILEQVYRDRGEDVYAFNVEALRAKILVPTTDVLWVDLEAYTSAPARPLAAWKTIPGWWEASEEEFYKRLVALLPNSGSFVEVGTWVGRSFACFDYWAKKYGKQIHQIAVDTFHGTQTEPMEALSAEQYPGGFRAEFEANMKRCGVIGYDVLAQKSVVAAAGERDRAFNAVFLDGDHSFEAVDADLRAWLPKIKPGGYICGHDFDRLSVANAVRTWFPANKIKVFGRCWITQVV